MKKSLLLLSIFTGSVASAGPPTAPAEAPNSANAVPEESIPSAECVLPKIPERAFIAQDDITYLKKQANDYAACMQKYIDARQTQITLYGQRQKTEADAANAAIKAVNEYFAKVKAFASQHEPKG